MNNVNNIEDKESTTIEMTNKKFQEILSVQDYQLKLNEKIIELSNTDQFWDLSNRFANHDVNIDNFFVALAAAAELSSQDKINFLCKELAIELVHKKFALIGEGIVVANNYTYEKLNIEIKEKNQNAFKEMVGLVKTEKLLRLLLEDPHKRLENHRATLEQKLKKNLKNE